jgi:protein phosphatase
MAIGAGSPLTVNYYAVRLEPGSLALLSSDGLHGVVEASRLEEILRGGRGASLEQCCQFLVDAAKEAGGPDNVTVVLLRKAAG